MARLRATAKHPKHPEGTVYEVAPVFALADKYREFGVLVPDDTPLSAEETPLHTKGRYKRRDLRASE